MPKIFRKRKKKEGLERVWEKSEMITILNKISQYLNVNEKKTMFDELLFWCLSYIESIAF